MHASVYMSVCVCRGTGSHKALIRPALCCAAPGHTG